MADHTPAKLALELQLMSKRIKEFKTDCIRKHDKWGQNFRASLLALCLQFSTAREIANSNAVCSGWRLPQHLEDRLVKPLYVEDFTLTDSNHPKIAPREDSPWRVRYGRRQLVHKNILAWTHASLTNELASHDTTFFHANHRNVQLFSYRFYTGDVVLFSLPGLAVIQEGTIRSEASVHSDANALVCITQRRAIMYEIPSLQERESLDIYLPSFKALKGDYLVLVHSRGLDRMLSVRSISSKKQLWELPYFGVSPDCAVEETNRLLFICSTESVFAANLLDGTVVAKHILNSLPADIFCSWDGLPIVCVFNWRTQTLNHLRLSASNELVSARQLYLPPEFDHRMRGAGRIVWQQTSYSSYISYDLHLLDSKAGHQVSMKRESFVMEMSSLFALTTRGVILDFTVGLS